MDLFAPAAEPVVYKPRWYQTAAIESVRSLYDAGINRQLGVAATGAGKTVIATRLIEAFPDHAAHRTLFLVHLDELVWQAERKFKEVHPHLNVQVEKASYRADLTRADVVIASVQTLGRKDKTHPRRWSHRLRRMPDFGIIMVDEAHHCKPKGTYDRILDYFGVGSAPDRQRHVAPGLRPLVLGVTATANRGDGEGLHHFFDEVAFDYNLRVLVDEGYLVDIEAHRIETDTDISGVAVRRGDFAEKELQQATNTPERNAAIVRAFKQHGGNSFVAFTAGVEHAYDLADLFQTAGINAVGMDGSMKKEERAPLFKAFRSGEITGICSDSLIIEGFDAPIADTAIMAKPTKSQPRYQQCLGRVVRPLCDVNLDTSEERIAAIAQSTKPRAIVLDFVDVCAKHPVVTAPVLFGLNKDMDPKGERLITRVLKRVEDLEADNPHKNLRKAVSLDDLEIRAERVDVWDVVETSPEILALSPLKWLQLRPDMVQINVPTEKGSKEKGFYCRAVQDATGAWRVDRYYPAHWNGKFREEAKEAKGSVKFDTMQEAVKATDTWLRDAHGGVKTLMERAPSWGSGPATDGQITFLKRLKVPFARYTDTGHPVNDLTGKPITKGEASGLIDAAKSLTHR